MTILLAPDKFKGSLSASRVCDALQEELLSADSGYRIIALPMADGGEGTCELLTFYSGGYPVNVRVRDPLFREIDSGYGISKDGRTAFLEMAKASGLQLLQKYERNPMVTTTLGTGDLIRHALDSGVEHIIMGIGGSGTTDGGIGMAESLGVIYYSITGQKLSPVGKNLRYIHTMDTSGVHPRLQQVQFTIFCDVDNPLYGPRGAAYIFSPQKGADTDMVHALDEGLRHYERILERSLNREVDFAGAGAGGGLPASVKALANITIRGGMDFITEFTQLEEQVRSADVIITGEGKMDEQTLSGKVVKGIADLAAKYHKRLIVLAGKNELDGEHLQRLGAEKVITLTRENVSEEMAVKDAFRLIKQRVKEEIIPLFLSPSQS
jgi:glycerate 2-kinase